MFGPREIGFAEQVMSKIAGDAAAMSDLNQDIDLKDPRHTQAVEFVLTEVGMAAHGLKRKAGDAKDAADSQALYAARSLEYFDPRYFEFEHKKLNFRDLFPINHAADPADETISYEMEELVGEAGVTSDHATSVAHADVIAKEDRVDVAELDIHFEITTGDIRRAVKTGRPIEARKARAAHKAMEQKMHNTVISGDPDENIIGFLTQSYVAEDEVDAGASASTLWSTKTPKEIVIGDIGSRIATIKEQTFNNHRPNVLGVPIAEENILLQVWISDQFPKPLAQWIKEQLASYGIEEIVGMPELDGAGPSGKDMGALWEKDEEVCEVFIPMELKWLPGQPDGKKIKFTGEARISDFISRRPQAIRRFYGI